MPCSPSASACSHTMASSEGGRARVGPAGGQPQRREERPLQRADGTAHDRSRTPRHHRGGGPRVVRFLEGPVEIRGRAGRELAPSLDRGRARDLGPPRRGPAGPAALVLQVADAKDLRRTLLVTLQLGQLGMPTVLALNMSDEAEARGQRIDIEALARALGVPVRSTVATRGKGIGPLRAALVEACPPTNHLPLPEDIAPLVAAIFSGKAPLPDPEAPPPFVARYHEALLAHADALTTRVSSRPAADQHPARGPVFARRLGRLCVHPAGVGRSCSWSSPSSTSWSGSSGRARRRSARGRAVRPASQSLGQGRLRPPAQLVAAGPLRRGRTASSPWASPTASPSCCPS